MTAPWVGLMASQIDFPGGEQAILIVLRWIHLVAGITWVDACEATVDAIWDCLGSLISKEKNESGKMTGAGSAIPVKAGGGETMTI